MDVTTDIHAQPTMLWFTVKQIASKYIIQLSGYTTSFEGCQCFFRAVLGPDPSGTLPYPKYPRLRMNCKNKKL